MFRDLPPPLPKLTSSSKPPPQRSQIQPVRSPETRNPQPQPENPERPASRGSSLIKERYDKQGQSTEKRPFTESNPNSDYNSTYNLNCQALNIGPRAVFLTHCNSSIGSNTSQPMAYSSGNSNASMNFAQRPSLNCGPFNVVKPSIKPTSTSTLINKQQIGNLGQQALYQNGVRIGGGFQVGLPEGSSNNGSKAIQGNFMNHPNGNNPSFQPQNSGVQLQPIPSQQLTSIPSVNSFQISSQNSTIPRSFQNNNQPLNPNPSPPYTPVLNAEQMNQEMQLKAYMQSMMVNLLTPYVQTLTRIKQEELSRAQKAKEDEKLPEMLSIVDKNHYLNRLDEDNESHLRYSKAARRKNQKEVVVIKVIEESREQKMRRAREDKAFFERIKEEENMERFGTDQERVNYSIGVKSKRCKEEIYLNYLKRNEKRKNEDSRSGKQETENVFVSEFGEVRDLEYSVDLRWLEEPKVVRKKFKKSTVQVSDRPSDKELEEAIFLDLQKKGQTLQAHSIFKRTQFEYKRYKPNVFMKLFFGHKEVELSQFTLAGSIFERKINLPRDYKYQPAFFEGFKVKNLKIKNKYGSIFWKGETDIKDINFENGIRIAENEVEVKIPALEKEAIVQFYCLPRSVEGMSRERIERVLKKMAKGAEFLQLNWERKSWMMKIDFSKDQAEEQNIQGSEEDRDKTRAELLH